MKSMRLLSVVIIILLLLPVVSLAEEDETLDEFYAVEVDEQPIELGEIDLFNPEIYIENEIGFEIDGGEQAISAPEYAFDDDSDAWNEENDGGEQAVMAAGSWSAAYESFIIGQGYLTSKPFAELYAEWGAYDDYDIDWDEPEFGLYDMNRDGIPELLANNGGTCTANICSYAFTYQNGEVIYLGNVGWVYADLFYYENEAFPGVFSIFGGGQTTWFRYYYFSGDKFAREDILYLSDKQYIETKNSALLNLVSGKTKGRLISMVPYGKIVEMGWSGFVEYTKQIIEGAVVDAARYVFPDYQLNKVKNNGNVKLSVGDRLWIIPDFATDSGWTVKSYKSSKPKVASIDGDGLLTAKAEGTAKITVTTRNKKKATVTVKVVDPYKPTSVRITQGKSATLNLGQTLQLGATLAPSTAQTTLTWKSSKPKVATVDTNGLVLSKAKGTTKITVTTRNKKKATITIKVVNPYSDIAKYINKKLSSVRNKFGLNQYDAIYRAYFNGFMGAGQWDAGKGKVGFLEINAPCLYSINGIYIGMDMDEARTLLTKKGWKNVRDVGKYFVVEKGKMEMTVDSYTISGKQYGGVSTISYYIY